MYLYTYTVEERYTAVHGLTDHMFTKHPRFLLGMGLVVFGLLLMLRVVTIKLEPYRFEHTIRPPGNFQQGLGNAAWSPDGNRIAFQRYPNLDAYQMQSGYIAMDTDGGNLTFESFPDYTRLSTSPDGKQRLEVSDRIISIYDTTTGTSRILAEGAGP